jgi:hypothetical protein
MPVKLVAASRPIASLEDFELLTQDAADDNDDKLQLWITADTSLRI